MAPVVVLVMMLSLFSRAAMSAPSPNNNVSNGTDAPLIHRSMAPVVRLVGGSSGDSCSGRVEVYYDSQWWSVCDDWWELADAQVVCRELGCGKALSAPGGAHFGQGEGPIYQGNVNCTGSESMLMDCRHAELESDYCSHSEDAGVVCEGHADYNYDYTDPPLEIQAIHFVVGRMGEVRGYVNPVRFDVITDNTGHGFEKHFDFGYNKETCKFTAPFAGDYRFSLSALPCLGSQSSIWRILVNDEQRKLCFRQSGSVSDLCKYNDWLEAGDKVWVEQQNGCSWGMTFSGGSWQSNWYDWYYY